MAHCIRHRNAPAPVDVRRPEHLPQGDALSVYRNNHRLSLTAALAATFPTIARLIGDGPMMDLAGSFLDISPPTRPCVAEYGAGFPDFLAQEPMLGDLPYLADIASLDWALNRAAIAPDLAPIGASDIAAYRPNQLGDLRVCLHPGATLLESRFPLLEIRRFVERPGDGSFDLHLVTTSVLICRQRGVAAAIPLAPDSSMAGQALEGGANLASACSLLDRTPLADFLAGVLCSGAFAVAPEARSMGSVRSSPFIPAYIP